MPTKRTMSRKASSSRRRASTSGAKTSKRSAASKTLSLSSASPICTVNDLDRSIGWYTDVLGFTINDRWEQDGKLMGAELKAGPTTLWINQDDWKKGRDRVKGEGVRFFYVTTMDVDGLAKRITAKGGTLEHEPQDDFGMRAFGIQDPDGYKITIAKRLK